MKRIIYENLNKLYYSIGEVADLFEVNTSLIRFWEKEFGILKPKKNNKGNRQFTVKDIASIEKIYILVKEKGYTLDGAKKTMKSKNELEELLKAAEQPVSEKVILKLESIKLRLLKIKSEL
jgi:DNA-binding transcriptional MerR regulator